MECWLIIPAIDCPLLPENNPASLFFFKLFTLDTSRIDYPEQTVVAYPIKFPTFMALEIQYRLRQIPPDVCPKPHKSNPHILNLIIRNIIMKI